MSPPSGGPRWLLVVGAPPAAEAPRLTLRAALAAGAKPSGCTDPDPESDTDGRIGALDR